MAFRQWVQYIIVLREQDSFTLNLEAICLCSPQNAGYLVGVGALLLLHDAGRRPLVRCFSIRDAGGTFAGRGAITGRITRQGTARQRERDGRTAESGFRLSRIAAVVGGAIRPGPIGANGAIRLRRALRVLLRGGAGPGAIRPEGCTGDIPGAIRSICAA
jgi:hypothetical protein